MRRRGLALVLPLATALLLGAAAELRAQSSTAETLREAVALYEELQVERALTLLRQVVSPSSPFEVSREQRVLAYKYLGATLALLGMRDSAVVYFRAALERDPTTDLASDKFTAQERDALAEARRRTFALAVRPVAPTRIDARADSIAFVFVTTHAALLRAEVRPAGDTAGLVLFARESEGLREVPWNGLLAGGRLVSPGRYELAVTAHSLLTRQTEHGRAYFDVRHEFPPLEDTLPPLRPDELLPERYPASAATTDLLKGLGVAAAALALPTIVGSRQLGRGDRAWSGTVAASAAAAGLTAFVVRQRQREIPANVAENRRRQTARAERNTEVARQNSAKLAETKVVITPAAGLAP